MSVLLGNGNGTFQAPKTFATGFQPVSVTLGDVNGDGKPDLAVTDFSSNRVSVLLNIGLAANADPVCSSARAVPSVILSRDHKLQPIRIDGITDPDGDPLTFVWQQQGDATVSIAEPTAASTTFVAPDVKIAELISFKLIALDGETASEPAFVAITITPKPGSCGCTSLEPLLAIAVLFWFRRRRG